MIIQLRTIKGEIILVNIYHIMCVVPYKNGLLLFLSTGLDYYIDYDLDKFIKILSNENVVVINK